MEKGKASSAVFALKRLALWERASRLAETVGVSSSEKLQKAIAEGLEKTFRLKSSLSTQNYHLFDAQGRVRKFQDELEILREFADIRLTFYEVPLADTQRLSACTDAAAQETPVVPALFLWLSWQKRKAYLLATLEKERTIIRNKMRFVKAVLDGSVVINNKRRQALVEELFSLVRPSEAKTENP